MDEVVLRRDAAEAQDAQAPSGLQAGFEHWGSLIEKLPVGVYVCDAEGVVTQYNRRAAELWGQAPTPGDPSVKFCGSLRLRLPDGQPLAHEDCPVPMVLATGQAARDQQVIVERPDGSRVDVLANIEPLFDADGKVIGVVNCFQDVGELKRAQREVRQRDAWIRQVVDRSPVAIYWTDAEGRVLAYNAAAAALWGREPAIGEDRWCGSYKLAHPDGRPMPLEECPMGLALRTGLVAQGREALFERPDGSRGAFLAYPTLLYDAGGRLAGAVNMLVDISERKRAEERQKTLVDELNHRVKNTLASVQSLAAQSLRAEGDPQARLADFEARLVALSTAHDQLARRRWEDADLADLAAGVLAPYASDAVTLSGERIGLTAKAAVTLSMAMHELATNAAKYGALSTLAGRVELKWRVERAAGGRRLVLDWRESGGPPVSAPTTQGFGTRFLEGAIGGELGGRIEHRFAPEGVRCRVEIPL